MNKEEETYTTEYWTEEVVRVVERKRSICTSCGKLIVWLSFGYGNGKCSCSFWKTGWLNADKYEKTPYRDSYIQAINLGAVFTSDPYPEFWGELEYKENEHISNKVLARCKGLKEATEADNS